MVRPGEDPDAIAPEFVAEGRLEVSDEELGVEAEAQVRPSAEPAAGITEEPKAEAPETEDRPDTGTAAE